MDTTNLPTDSILRRHYLQHRSVTDAAKGGSATAAAAPAQAEPPAARPQPAPPPPEPARAEPAPPPAQPARQTAANAGQSGGWFSRLMRKLFG